MLWTTVRSTAPSNSTRAGGTSSCSGTTCQPTRRSHWRQLNCPARAEGYRRGCNRIVIRLCGFLPAARSHRSEDGDRSTGNPLPSPLSIVIASGQVLWHSLVVYEADALSFPFVEALPKREKSRLQKVWERFEEIKAITEQKGQLVPAKLAAALLDVSKQRVDQLCDAGLLERVYVEDHPYVTEASIVERCKVERKAGRPFNLPTTISGAFQVAKNSLKK